MSVERDLNYIDYMQQDICNMWGINTQERYVFYYDESNNCRKFWADRSKQRFNTDYKADFVLAGIVRKEDEHPANVSLESFKKHLGLQKNVKEIKFKKHYAKGDFLQSVNEKRLLNTLSWIEKSPYYIHYTNVNNLYYTLVEIFDSIVEPEEISDFGYDYFRLKSVFYYMLESKANELQTLMIKYKYPNIQHSDVGTFCRELLFLLGSRVEMDDEQKFLAGMLNRASNKQELIFLQNNKDYIMQENYVEFYIDPIRKHRNSMHIFDEEPNVQEIVSSLLLQEDNVKINYMFVKSEAEIFVQLSDVVAGILGKIFTYINSTSLKQRRKDIEKLSKLQMDNIILIDKLRDEAGQENPGFLCSVAPLGEVKLLNDFFNRVKQQSEYMNN